ncbi:MAG: proprotein convertase P-domain-containing protein [Verrucomicrobiae bacterium]|nr:proprotein convertase P-domain-containing protein [Verrucomicrobiae bacterium]
MSQAAPISQPAPNSALFTFSTLLDQPTVIADSSTNFGTFFLNNTTGTVWDVNLDISLFHGRPSDLEIYLTSPQGTRVTLTAGNGPTNYADLFNPLLFDDQAQIPLSDYVITNSGSKTTLIPEGSLDKFEGENPEGTWQLSVVDTQSGYSGILSNATLTVTTMTELDITHTHTVTVTNPAALLDLDQENNLFTVTVTNIGHFLAQVKVQTWLQHPICSDLDIYLISPAGTFMALTTDNGQKKANVFYGTTWDDHASILVTQATYTNDSPYEYLVPEGALAACKGENPNGTWTLLIVDDTEFDTGTLEKWSLTFETLPGLITDVTGDDFTDIITVKKKSVYVIPMKNGAPIGGALLAGFIPNKKYKPVAVNEFTGDQQADLLLQHDTFLTILAFSNSYLINNPIDLGVTINPNYQVVATSDLNQDGLIDFISQNKSQLGVTLTHKKENAVSYQFQQLEIGQSGTIVGINRTNLFQQIKSTLYSIPIVYEGSNSFHLGEPVMISSDIRPSFKIRGVAELSPLNPGSEFIIQQGSAIAYGPTNVARHIKPFYKGKGRGNLGKVIGPK